MIQLIRRAFVLVILCSFPFALAQTYTINRVAGTYAAGYSGDGGAATSAMLNFPDDVAVDVAGNVYIADTANNRIRKVAVNGVISTIAGDGTCGYNGDGIPAATARLCSPSGVATDANGNLYVADSLHHRLRRIGTDGIIRTIAGTGAGGACATGGRATETCVDFPLDIAVDTAGNVFVSQFFQNRVLRVTPANVITTVAGNGTTVFSGDGGQATAAGMKVRGIALDTVGNLFLADDFSHRVRRVDPNGIITTVAGSGSPFHSGDDGPSTAAGMSPYGIVTGGNGVLFVADYFNHRVRRVVVGGNVVTIAGTSTFGSSGDGGLATEAKLQVPKGIARDSSGQLFVADTFNDAIRKLSSGARYSLTAASAFVGPAASSGSVGVLVSGAGSWTASSNVPWITITAGASGSATGIVNYSVSENPNPAARTGTLIVANSVYTLYQQAAGSPAGARFIPVTPCRVMDTRPSEGFPANIFGPPAIAGGATRQVPIPTGRCGIPSGALAYSFNVTVVPIRNLSYLTIWPTGLAQPLVSTLNSFDGRITANAAVVPAGANGSVNVFVSDAADVILDINGYFAAPAAPGGLAFYPVTPCRVADTRPEGGLPGAFGHPYMTGGQTRDFPIPQRGCGIPSTAQAYALNMTVVPRSGPLYYLTVWPAGKTRPLVSTLNAFLGEIAANMAIVPSGTGGAISVFVTNDTEVIIDVTGYFAPPSTGGLSFYTQTPCRIMDTRNSTGAFGGPSFSAAAPTRDVPVPSSACNVPPGVLAYSLNVTVVPSGPLYYLTTWPTGVAQPGVSTLNSFDGRITANAAIPPAGADGSISVFTSLGVTQATDVILDINGFFAP